MPPAEQATADALVAARRALVGPLMMFPGRAVARTVRGWRYTGRHSHASYDVTQPQAGRLARMFLLASRHNLWPAVAVHSVVPQWLARPLQWTAVGRMKIKNRLKGGGPGSGQPRLMADRDAHDHRGRPDEAETMS